ncbi:MAG: acetylxylan esterase, partial [Planctomycetaceae bacterium]|nr:acetylxylan esterase [Planctomycetaceae bacterium]
YFPFEQVASAEAWPARQAEIRRRILVSQGLWPLPTKAPLNAVVHGRVERDDYTVDRVFFESMPGHYVTGSLYRPKGKSGPFPAILSPHGHWNEGRFYAHKDDELRKQLSIGAERWEQGGRYPLQARALQLARMGCVVFLYDMTGYADSIQLGHGPANQEKLNGPADWGFGSVQAELRLQNMMGLQTWNSIRGVDFLLSLDDVDPQRIGVTGASGGGTQSMLVSAIDERIAASMPCVMVSTAMQGGCTCENAPLLRIRQGNVDIAAATAPRPLGLTAADDWTRELKTKGYPDLVKLYQMLGHPERLTAAFHTEFTHNYNHVNRAVMYGFFNRHFQLGFEEPVLEREFQPLTREEATVWTESHPAPSGEQVGAAHEIRILQLAAQDAEEQVSKLIPKTRSELARYRDVVGGAWETILGRSIKEVGNVELTESLHEERDGYVVVSGLVQHADAGEAVPSLFLHPTDNWNRQVVVWVTDDGKSGIWENDQPIDPVRQLLQSGYSVASADLFGQGEFNPKGQTSAEKQMWEQPNGKNSWSPFAGYTFGYNHPVFVKRVHDVLSMLAFAQRHELQPEKIHLVGIGNAAGPIAVAARSQAADAVATTFADLGDFRFGAVQQVDDPMFVPGAVKYLDVDGLTSLSAGPDMVVAVVDAPEVSESVAAVSHDPASGTHAGPVRVSTSSELIEQIVNRLTNKSSRSGIR